MTTEPRRYNINIDYLYCGLIVDFFPHAGDQGEKGEKGPQGHGITGYTGDQGPIGKVNLLHYAFTSLFIVESKNVHTPTLKFFTHIQFFHTFFF